MEYQRVYRRRYMGLLLFMLMGDRMCSEKDQVFVDGTQQGGLIDRQCNRLMPWDFITDYFNRKKGALLSPMQVRERLDQELKVQSPGRYQPAKTVVKTIAADRRYYKLASGDILDMESKTIINRESLQALLNY